MTKIDILYWISSPHRLRHFYQIGAQSVFTQLALILLHFNLSREIINLAVLLVRLLLNSYKNVTFDNKSIDVKTGGRDPSSRVPELPSSGGV